MKPHSGVEDDNNNVNDVLIICLATNGPRANYNHFGSDNISALP
jgi:hypothetical protein